MFEELNHPLEINFLNLESKDSKAELYVFDYFEKLGFSIKRFYFLKGSQPGIRGNHKHENCFQIIVAINNSSTIALRAFDSKEYTFTLTPFKNAVVIPRNYKIELMLEKDSICLALASDTFENTITTN